MKDVNLVFLYHKIKLKKKNPQEQIWRVKKCLIIFLNLLYMQM